jgi:hypothetical protein
LYEIRNTEDTVLQISSRAAFETFKYIVEIVNMGILTLRVNAHNVVASSLFPSSFLRVRVYVTAMSGGDIKVLDFFLRNILFEPHASYRDIFLCSSGNKKIF